MARRLERAGATDVTAVLGEFARLSLNGLRKLCPWSLERRVIDPVAELFARAKTLPAEARARLAEELLASLDPHETEVEAAWDEELRHRIDEAVQVVPADEAFALIRSQKQRFAHTLASLRKNRIDLDGSLKDWIGRGLR